MTSNFKFSQCADEMNAGDAGLRLLGMPSHVLVWFLAYAYAFVIAIVLQKLVMPLMPNLHAGHGLMNYDAIIFHDMAVAIANRIHEFGWSEWRLIPGQGITANVGILAAIYALLGPDPVWFIPLSAGFHALGATLIMRIATLILPGKSGLLAGVVTALLFLVFPSSLVWYGQNHKDGFLIAGYLLVVFAYVRAVGRSSLKVAIARDVYLMVAGCFLIAVMRPHMMLVYTVAFTGAFFGAVLIQLIKTRRARTTYIFNGAMMLAILMFAAAMTPSASSEFTTTRSSIVGEVGWSWEKSGLLPDFVEKKLEQVSFVRTYFIYTGKSVAAGSIIDEDITPTNAVDMAAYLPRALWVGIFSPFPNSWLVRPTLPRAIGVIETLIFYLAAAGILILAWRKPSLNLFSCLLVSSLVLVVLSYTSPNVGTLHRIRYGPLFIFMLAGISGWVLLVTSVSGRLGKTWAPRHREGLCNRACQPNLEQPPILVVNKLLVLARW